MYFMSDPQALHITRNVIPGKLGVDLHLHRVHIPLVNYSFAIPASSAPAESFQSQQYRFMTTVRLVLSRVLNVGVY